MPPGTPPEKVLAAVRNFAREEFALRHRYAFVLHTDEPHPHVHLVLKAVSERGIRLNIKKATLRHWRSEFAKNLRLLRVEANATERAVRAETRIHKRDGIYRTHKRGESTHMRERTESVASKLLTGDLQIEPGKAQISRTRKEVERGWLSASEVLARQGQAKLTDDVLRFMHEMQPATTGNERIAAELRERVRNLSGRVNERAP